MTPVKVWHVVSVWSWGQGNHSCFWVKKRANVLQLMHGWVYSPAANARGSILSLTEPSPRPWTSLWGWERKKWWRGKMGRWAEGGQVCEMHQGGWRRRGKKVKGEWATLSSRNYIYVICRPWLFLLAYYSDGIYLFLVQVWEKLWFQFHVKKVNSLFLRSPSTFLVFNQDHDIRFLLHDYRCQKMSR